MITEEEHETERAKYTPKQIRRIARFVRICLGIDNQRRPNLYELLRSLERIFPNFRLKIFSKTRFPAREAWSNFHTRTIYLRDDVLGALLCGNKRARFTVAHEIGHLILRHPRDHYRKAIKRFVKDSKGRPRLINRPQEKEANIFATELLMPGHLLSKLDTPRTIGEAFHVSCQAAKYREREFQRLTAEKDDFVVNVAMPLEQFLREGNLQDPPTRKMSPRDFDENTLLEGRPFDATAHVVFVLMDFSKERYPLYSELLKPVVEDLHLICRRGDEVSCAGTVVDKLRESIATSLLVIAEITNFNPNVMNEIGMAQAANKPILLLCQSNYEDSQIPHNIRHLQRLPYANDAPGGIKLRRELTDAIKAILQSLARPTKAVA